MKSKQKWGIDLNDAEMCEWAYRYLRIRFQLPPNAYQVNLHQLFWDALNAWGTEDARKLLLLNMQNAWRQEKNRLKKKKEGKTKRSYDLNNDTLKQLDDLSIDLKLTLSQTLEEIIKQAYNNQQAKKKRKTPNPTSTTGASNPLLPGRMTALKSKI